MKIKVTNKNISKVFSKMRKLLEKQIIKPGYKIAIFEDEKQYKAFMKEYNKLSKSK